MIAGLVTVLLMLSATAPALAQPGIAGQSGPASTVAAQPIKAESGPTWAQLPAAHQLALAPLKQHWAGIDATRKSKWVVVAQRFPALPAAERQRVQARMAEWANMSPNERGRARQNFQELRNLPQDDRQALWEAYRALPDEQKREFAHRAKPVAKAAEQASASSGKRRVAVNPAPVVIKPVTPTVVQAKPGATTTLVTKAPTPPAHHQPGMPKITATDGFVNPTTLLPNRGPQGAATHSAAASAGTAPGP